MAAPNTSETNQIQCEPCLYNTISVQADFWCLSCEDGLCKVCTHSHKGIRATRDHKVITVEKYHEIKGDDVLVSQECKKHDKMFDLYCIDHEIALCALCLKHGHRECKILSLDEASKNVTSSTNFTRFEKNVDNLAEYLNEQVEHRRDNLNKLDEERSTVGLKINDVINRFHSQIDNYDQKLKEKLASSYGGCKDVISREIQTFKSIQEKMGAVRRKFGHLKEVASNNQLFLAVSETSLKILQDVDQVQKEFSDKKIKRSLELELSSELDQVIKLDTLGSVTISETKLSCSSRLKMAEAQLPSGDQTVALEHITLSEELQVTSPEPDLYSKTSGCRLLSNSDLLFNSSNNLSIKVFKTGKGSTFDMKTPYELQDFTVVSSNNNIIAVTYGNKSLFEIADITNYEYKTKRSIKTKSTCWGISSNKDLIAVKCTFAGIQLYNLEGDWLRQLDIDSYDCYNISTTDHRIYCSKPDKSSVSCFDLQGKELWNVQNLTWPTELTVGSSGEVFVVATNGLLIISEDGSRVRNIDIDNELTQTTSVSFCKSSVRLLVRNLHLEINSQGKLSTKLYDKPDDIIFPIVNYLIVNFPFFCNNIPSAPAYNYLFVTPEHAGITSIFLAVLDTGYISYIDTPWPVVVHISIVDLLPLI